MQEILESTIKDIFCTVQDVKNNVCEIDPVNLPRYSLNDAGSGLLFADVFKYVARYNPNAKKWFVYDGKVWKRDEGEMIVNRLAANLYRALVIYAGSITDADTMQKYLRYAQRLGDRPVREKLIKDAREVYHVASSEFDKDPYLFNCQNVVVDLKTGKIIEHNPDLFLSKIANVTYDPTAKSCDFLDFVSAIMCDNKEKTRYLQKVLGYSMTGINNREEMYICYGATTRNGKSTLLETFGTMMGGYCANVSPESLAMKPRDSRSASGDIARLEGVRFAHCSEPPKRMAFDVALLKTLIGRDTITARKIYEGETEFMPIFKLIMNTNYLPVVSDPTLFSSGRVKIISFDRHFSPKEQDKSLKDRLKKEEVMSGILNWCIEGCLAWQSDGLQPPQCVEEATNEYKKKSDKIGRFLDECVEYSKGWNMSISQVYTVYQEWCTENGYSIENKGNFMTDLQAKMPISATGTVQGKTIHNVVKDCNIVQERRTQMYHDNKTFVSTKWKCTGT